MKHADFLESIRKLETPKADSVSPPKKLLHVYACDNRIIFAGGNFTTAVDSVSFAYRGYTGNTCIVFGMFIEALEAGESIIEAISTAKLVLRRPFSN